MSIEGGNLILSPCEKIKIYKFNEDGIITLNPKFRQLWCIFNDSIIHPQVHACYDSSFNLPPTISLSLMV